ncbi:MAG: hypothetical protein IKB30_01890, partial [Clostridia bacterium]|nr:hypothetical protein [Clostridia bacterium]
EESSTFNYNLGSTDNPILITDAAQLSMISEEVEAGTTDYAGMNFQLANNIALDNGFTPIASTFAGNILGDGKQVSGELVVELVDGKTATELNYVENVIIPTHFLELNSDTFVGYDAKTNPDGEKGAIYNASNNFYTDKGTLITEETWKEDGITGDYSGNAIKITANYYMNWTLTNPYNQAQINKLADNYDFVRFYLAGASTDETDTSWYYNLGGGMLGAYYGNDSDNASIAYSRAKQWIEFKFSIEKFVELLNSASFEFFNVHWNKAGGKEGGNATATVVLYMSNIEFVTEPTPTHWFKVSEQSWATDRILYNDSSVKYQPGGDFVTYMNETEVSELGFAGGYTGAAVRYTSQNNSGWSLKNIFSERQLSKIKDTYDHLYIWFAAAPISDETTEWSDPMTEDLIALTSTGQTSIPVNNTNQKIWRKFIVPIDSFITYLGENSAVGFFNRGWGNGKWGEAYYYFGDIGFGNASTIEIFGKTASLTDLTSGQDVDITYLSSSELASAGVTAGGYTGNAVKFSLGSSSVYRKFYLTVPTFTDAEKEEILSTYTNVSMYIYTNKGQANAGLYVNTTSDNYWNHTHNTWKKYTITVQQYFDYVEANASDGKVLLFYNYISTQANAPTVEVYFGNISFE